MRASMTELVALSDKQVLWRLRQGKWEQMFKVILWLCCFVFLCSHDPTPKDIASVQLGMSFGAALSSDKMLLLWGVAESGRLGNGNEQDESQSGFVPGFFVSRSVELFALGPSHGGDEQRKRKRQVLKSLFFFVVALVVD